MGYLFAILDLARCRVWSFLKPGFSEKVAVGISMLRVYYRL